MVYSWELKKFPTRCFLGTDSTPSRHSEGAAGPLFRGSEAGELESGAFSKKGLLRENGITQILGFGKSVTCRTVIQNNLPVQLERRWDHLTYF